MNFSNVTNMLLILLLRRSKAQETLKKKRRIRMMRRLKWTSKSVRILSTRNFSNGCIKQLKMKSMNSNKKNSMNNQSRVLWRVRIEQ